MSIGTYAAGSRSASSSKRTLIAGAAPVFHQRDPRPDEVRDLTGALAQDRELAAREIVLVERADALEEPRADVVVEEFRRQRLSRAAEAVQHVGEDLARLERPRAARRALRMHRGAHAFLARRMPMNCQRASDGKKLRYVTRAWDRGVAHDAPRSTHWSHIHLPLYSPSAPADGA